MKNIELGQVIAERHLTSDLGAMRVSVGLPRQFALGEDYFCPFKIDGPITKKTFLANGVDTVQALVLALKTIAAMLEASEERKAHRLRWFDGDEDLGFPMPDCLADLAQR